MGEAGGGAQATGEGSRRLPALARLVPPGRVVADVGTDHALLPIDLVRSGRTPHVIACDLRAGPLVAARARVEAAGLCGAIELRQGDGLCPLRPGEARVLILSGMGGTLIREILARSPEVAASAPAWVLQPQGGDGSLRRWLAAAGRRIDAEDLVLERGRFYVMMRAVPGREPLLGEEEAEILWQVGPRLWEDRHPLLRPWLAGKVDRLRRAERSAAVGGGDRRARELAARREILERALDRL